MSIIGIAYATLGVPHADSATVAPLSMRYLLGNWLEECAAYLARAWVNLPSAVSATEDMFSNLTRTARQFFSAPFTLNNHPQLLRLPCRYSRTSRRAAALSLTNPFSKARPTNNTRPFLCINTLRVVTPFTVRVMMASGTKSNSVIDLKYKIRAHLPRNDVMSLNPFGTGPTALTFPSVTISYRQRPYAVTIVIGVRFAPNASSAGALFWRLASMVPVEEPVVGALNKATRGDGLRNDVYGLATTAGAKRVRRGKLSLHGNLLSSCAMPRGVLAPPWLSAISIIARGGDQTPPGRRDGKTDAFPDGVEAEAFVARVTVRLGELRGI